MTFHTVPALLLLTVFFSIISVEKTQDTINKEKKSYHALKSFINQMGWQHLFWSVWRELGAALAVLLSSGFCCCGVWMCNNAAAKAAGWGACASEPICNLCHDKNQCLSHGQLWKRNPEFRQSPSLSSFTLELIGQSKVVLEFLECCTHFMIFRFYFCGLNLPSCL